MVFGHFLKQKKKKKIEKKKHNEIMIKDRIIRDIWAPFEQEREEEYYYWTKRTSNCWNNNYIESESNVDKNRNLSDDEYLNKIESYLRNIITYFQNLDACKIQLKLQLTLFLQK